MWDDCCIAISINSSYYNSVELGYNFWFYIKAFSGDYPQETFKGWWVIKHMACSLAVTQSNLPHLIDMRQQMVISAEEIKENYPLYQQIKALCPWPNEDKWTFILAALVGENINM